MGLLELKRFLGLFAGGALLVAACGGSSAKTETPPSPTAVAPTEQPAATTAPSTNGSLQPDGNRILADVKLLADGGPRSSATDLERFAADEIADRLRKLGYEVSIQEFSVASQQGRSSVLTVLGASQRTVPTLPLSNSPTATAQGKLVAAGIGRPEDFPADTRGAVALIERGTLTFQEKVANAKSAGAQAVIIYNSEAGTFLGSADSVAIPAVTISQDQGKTLAAAISGGEVRVEVGVGALSNAVSRNVIAKAPGGAQCATISGGHYDSVPQAPGASDNATGTATVLEIAVDPGRPQGDRQQLLRAVRRGGAWPARQPLLRLHAGPGRPQPAQGDAQLRHGRRRRGGLVADRQRLPAGRA